MQDQAAMELERERNRRREEELLAQQSSSHPGLVEEGELQAEVARLQLLETKQKEEIHRCMCVCDSSQVQHNSALPGQLSCVGWSSNPDTLLDKCYTI